MNVADTIIRHASCETIQSNVLSLQNCIQEPVSINLSLGPLDCVTTLQVVTHYLDFLRNEDGNILLRFFVSPSISQGKIPQKMSFQNYRKQNFPYADNRVSFPVNIEAVP